MRPFATISGVLMALGPVPLALISWAHGPAIWRDSPPLAAAALICMLALMGGGLFIYEAPRIGRALATAGLVSTLMLIASELAFSPALALSLLLPLTAVVSTLYGVNPFAEGKGPGSGAVVTRRARGAALGAMLFWIVLGLMDSHDHPMNMVALASSLAASLVLSMQWLAREGRRNPQRAALWAGAALLVTAGAVARQGGWQHSTNIAALLPVATLFILPASSRWLPAVERVDWWEPVLGHPARLLAATFLALSAGGTLLLALPVCAASQHSIGFMNAAFTAVSAVCVTGLAVLDTPRDFSFVGQLGILVLIQLGGLGIMTFSTAAMRLLGRRLSLSHEGAVAGLMSAEDRSQLFRATLRLIGFTVIVEIVGALCLTAAFYYHGDQVDQSMGQSMGQSLGQSLWRGIFTSISAFCNAGFALHSDSLIGYQHSPLVLHIIGVLIIAGGISPMAVLAVPALARGHKHRVSTQTKLVLTTTAILLVAGFLAIAVIEWDASLAGMPVADRLHNAWFQSVTLRTAGFNSIDIAAVQPATYALMLAWMFIGGSPGGTAGGIKTTTAAVLALSVAATMRGRTSAHAFGRSLSHKTMYKAMAIVTVGATAVFAAFLAMQLTQGIAPGSALFEVVSALGTVGLSVGATAELDGVGKVIIIACMFMGRVGSLTLFMFLSGRMMRDAWRRPEEAIEVG